ncbi:hypothetical protein BH18ACT12_BH18ACT12_04660 [soil metagenome]
MLEAVGIEGVMRGFLRLVFFACSFLLLFPAAAVQAAPQLTVPGPITAEAQDASGADVTYTVTASNPAGKPVTVSCAPPGAMAAGTFTATVHFPLGVATVTCSVIDETGAVEATASFTVTVRDTTPPVIAGTPAVQVDTAGGGGAVVTYVQPTAVDLVDGPVPVSCSPASGSLFPVGSTSVSCTASDSRGNTATATFAVTVTAPTPAPTPSPPPPPPPPPGRSVPDTVPPDEVGKVQVESITRAIRLSWALPSDPDFDHIEVQRASSSGDATLITVYSGSASSFTDRGVRPGTSYRYVIVTVDHVGNRSVGIAVAATAKLLMLLSPREGATLKRPPRLVWRSFPSATYYNLQLFRGSQKIFSAWPIRTQLRVKKTWIFGGKRYTLGRGTYRWYVWPGLGRRSATDYGPLLGDSSFTVKK